MASLISRSIFLETGSVFLVDVKQVDGVMLIPSVGNSQIDNWFFDIQSIILVKCTREGCLDVKNALCQFSFKKILISTADCFFLHMSF